MELKRLGGNLINIFHITVEAKVETYCSSISSGFFTINFSGSNECVPFFFLNELC